MSWKIPNVLLGAEVVQQPVVKNAYGEWGVWAVWPENVLDLP